MYNIDQDEIISGLNPFRNKVNVKLILKGAY